MPASLYFYPFRASTPLPACALVKKPTSWEYRGAVKAIIKAVKRYQVNLLLLDSRQKGPLPLADQQWLANKAISHLNSGSLIKFAYLHSTDLFHHMTSEQLLQKIKQRAFSFTLRPFLLEQEALEWLLRIEPEPFTNGL